MWIWHESENGRTSAYMTTFLMKLIWDRNGRVSVTWNVVVGFDMKTEMAEFHLNITRFWQNWHDKLTNWHMTNDFRNLWIRHDTKILNFRYTRWIFLGVCESDMTHIWTWQTIFRIMWSRHDTKILKLSLYMKNIC